MRALGRVLLWNHFVIPQWHIAYDRRVFWNMFGIPKVIPMLGSSFDLWWIDAAKVAALDRRMSKTKAN